MGAVLLESADPATPAIRRAGQGTRAGVRSVVTPSAALQLTCRGRTVTVEALCEAAAPLLPPLLDALRDRATSSLDAFTLRSSFAARDASLSDRERLLAPSPMDVPRALLRLLRQGFGDSGSSTMLVGTFSYDLLGSYETLPEASAEPSDWPDFELWLPDRITWVDHVRRSTRVVALAFTASQHEAAVAAATQLARDVEHVAQARRAGATAGGDLGSTRHVATNDDVQVDLDDDAFAEIVSTLQGHIRAGDIFQAVPSRTFSTPCVDALAAYRRLRDLNPSPYQFYVEGQRGTLFGASPETAVEVSGEPLALYVRPLAGTRARGLQPDGTLDADLDGRIEVELRLDAKELAEHMMLVDLARNDVARVSRSGTRRVSRLLEVVRYSHVMHLESEVVGALDDALDALHAYVATMNMGTLTGAPKLKAAELLRHYEVQRRGVYGGAVGYVRADGVMDTAIVIRSALVHEGRAYVRAGAGVVDYSDPLSEADESRRKAQAVLDAIKTAGTTIGSSDR
ncbi:MAG: anthranilate synthase component 1 [Myxococcales bacterium]|nr:anthranilate synthase component 1 [Myxococcales bacterium]